jgi:hypothetical protein
MMEFFLFVTASRTVLRSTQSPVHMGTGGYYSGVKRSGRETDHSPSSSVEVKYAWSYTFIPPLHLDSVVEKR